jgi:hypothetical protein
MATSIVTSKAFENGSGIDIDTASESKMANESENDGAFGSVPKANAKRTSDALFAATSNEAGILTDHGAQGRNDSSILCQDA